MPGYILIGCVILLIILLIKQSRDKGITIYNVYTDDDDEFEKKNEKTDTINQYVVDIFNDVFAENR